VKVFRFLHNAERSFSPGENLYVGVLRGWGTYKFAEGVLGGGGKSAVAVKAEGGRSLHKREIQEETLTSHKEEGSAQRGAACMSRKKEKVGGYLVAIVARPTLFMRSKKEKSISSSR